MERKKHDKVNEERLGMNKKRQQSMVQHSHTK